MSIRRLLIVALAAAGLIGSHVVRLDAQNGCNPSQLTFKVTVTGATYDAVPSTVPVSGFFTTGQDADILVSGIDFNNTGGSLLFNHPGHIASDGTRLVMTDTWNNRVLIWNSPPASNVAPDVVLGQLNFTTNNPGTGRGQMNWPISVSIGGGKLFVTDTYNHRLLIWNSIPTNNGTDADVVIDHGTLSSQQYPWPWGVWSDGTKLVATTISNPGVLVWNSVPTSDNIAPAFVLTAGGALGTPRHVTSDGKTLIVGSHNASVPGKSEVGSFFWTTFPTGADSAYSFFREDPIWPLFGPWMTGTFIDSALWAFGGSVYKWNTAPISDSTLPDLSLTGYTYFGGDSGGVAYAGGRLYVAAGNANKILGFNSLPATSATWPDFAVGSPDICTNTLDTNFFIRNPVARSNGSNLFVASDANAKLYVWRSLPDQSNPHPDLVYELPFQPWAIDVRGNTLVLGGYEKVYIWETLPLNGEMPTRMFNGTIGNVTLKMVKGVGYDGRYFYVADDFANKIYVWKGLPQAGSNPAFALSINRPQRLSSDGVYLAVTEPYDHVIAIYDVATLNESSTPTTIGGNWTFNLAQDVFVAFGRLFVADTNFGRVHAWSSIANALAGTPADVILGNTADPQTQGWTEEIGRNKLFLPGSVSFDGRFLWVGELKFSDRLLRFSANGSACSYARSPSTQSVAEPGGAVTIGVTSGSGCTWTASSNQSWITVTSGAIGSGTGTVGLSVAANAGASRTGTLMIAGSTYTVTQAGLAAPGSVIINAEPAGVNATAPWTMTGPDSFSQTGTGDLTLTSLAPGDYTLTWGDVNDGWSKPLPAFSTQTLASGGTITFTGTYTPTGIPQIQITPSSLYFGYVKPGEYKDLTLEVKNIGTGTLTGTVSVSPPFSIVSGGNYSLEANQTQQVVVRYTAPLEKGAQTGSLIFTGGGGLTIQVKGTNQKVGLPWLLLLLGN